MFCLIVILFLLFHRRRYWGGYGYPNGYGYGNYGYNAAYGYGTYPYAYGAYSPYNPYYRAPYYGYYRPDRWW